MPKQIGLIFQRDGAIPHGIGSFMVSFAPPFRVPAGAKNCTVSLVSSRIWNSFHNISGFKRNNKFRYYNGTTWFVGTLDNGLYTVDDLLAELRRIIVANGDAGTNLDFDPEFSTGYLNIILTSGWKIDWTNNNINDTFRKLVGFVSTANNTITSTGLPIQGDAVGDFSAVSSVEVHSSFGKMTKNGRGGDILDSFPLTAKPSFLNFYQAINPVKSDASHLVGTSIENAYFRLTDQNENELEVVDDWGVTIMLEYDE